MMLIFGAIGSRAEETSAEVGAGGKPSASPLSWRQRLRWELRSVGKAAADC